MLEVVLNVSEGRRAPVLARLADAAGTALLDLHADPYHHRAVLTIVGEDAVRAVTEAAVAAIDLRRHAGAHPRLGALDVAPFVPLAGATMDEAVAARDGFARWLGRELRVPAFHYGYGVGRTLPEVRRGAFRGVAPDAGPDRPHPTAGACAVGARAVLVAYNVWLAEADLGRARAAAAAVRDPAVRALGLRVGPRVQVSMNLVDPGVVGPAEAYDRVAAHVPVAGAQLVGLVPEDVLAGVPARRWAELDLAPGRTIEARLAARGFG